jgi:hypothetical protein
MAMEKRDEQNPGRTRNPQPQGDDLGQQGTERQRTPGRDRNPEEEDEEIE